MRVALHTLPQMAADVLEKLPAKPDGATMLFLQGELGAGKTTFTQALARELGITEPVQSPTYVIMKSYPLSGQRFEALVHLDLYRIESPEELAPLKLGRVFAKPKTLVVIEWPERAGGALPKADLSLRLSSDGAGESERHYHI